MQDIIQKIIEIDKMAQKMTDDARAMKDEILASIDSDKRKLREQYIARARHRIAVTAQTEKAFLDETLADIDKKYADIAKRLKDIYDEKHTQWVDELFHRVVGG